MTDGRGHILIAGAGRAGTTLTLRILGRLGLDIGFTEAEIAAAEASPARAGLEHPIDRRTAASLPLVIKSPHVVDVLPEALAEGWLRVDLAIVPVRELGAATESRLAVWRAAQGRDRKPWLAPGGLWKTRRPEAQRGVLAEQFHRLVETLVAHETPIAFLSFPRLAEDGAYFARILAPWLGARFGLAEADILAAHRREAKPSLITRRDASPPAAAG